MPFYLRIPLPGPFTYSQRIGGRRRNQRGSRKPRPSGIPVTLIQLRAIEAAVRKQGLTMDWFSSLSARQQYAWAQQHAGYTTPS